MAGGLAGYWLRVKRLRTLDTQEKSVQVVSPGSYSRGIKEPHASLEPPVADPWYRQWLVMQAVTEEDKKHAINYIGFRFSYLLNPKGRLTKN